MMKKISRRSFLQVVGLLAATAALTACGGKTETVKKDDTHEVITFMAPYMEEEAFIEQVHSVYPEVNIEIVPYSGDNTTTCLQNMFEANDLPDICTLTVYDPMTYHVSDKLLDLSGYDFTDNYVESRLQEVSDNGAIYLLPSSYNCYGITYNKTLLREHGWELPNSFAELEALAAEAKEAGVDLCLPQIQYPGYGFQYLCNIADADFLGTLDGKLWQKDYLSGEANVSNTPGMMQAMAYVQKWKDIGMLNDSGDALDDNVTRQRMTEGNTLFLIGGTNGIVESDDNADKFGLMPYLSEDGTQNVFVLKVNRFYGLNKKLEQNPQKLEDALKVMRVLSTVEGSSALIPAKTLKCSLLPFKDAKADDTYYADVADVLNAGNTAPFIYSGWENTIVTTGTKMLDFIKGDATMEDVIRQMDEDQDSVVNNTPDTITTVTEELSQEDCAMLVGRCFAQATGSDLALVSLSTWIPGNPTDQNHHGVAAKLYAKGITDYDLSVILPTGWNRTIQTVTLTGQQINDLLATGYDAYGNGKGYPYVMASPVQPEADKTYQVAICGVSDQLAAEADVVDSGVVGMDAAKAFFGAYTSISRADTAWS
ncbi:extracellular solute-binding protein [Gemmiger formicilis]|jgi:raffinose/stachyose/melibiose transport system substrate-binding protein|uniref:extracellular solute-binding protein n=1 Tax=Gemmiger formicilis TaxID=745368 RepID=UPI003AB1548C